MTGLTPLKAGFGFSDYRRSSTSHPVSTQIDPTVQQQHRWPRQQDQQYHRPDVVHNTLHYKRHPNHLFKEKYPDFAELGRSPPSKRSSGHYDYLDAMKTLQAPSPLMEQFFSTANIDHLQNCIIDHIYRRSRGQYRISRQSDDQLFIIMRSVYLRAPKDPLNRQNIPQQIHYLNTLVLHEVIPIVIENIQAHLGYIRDQGQALRPLDRPMSTNTAGLKLCHGSSSLIP